MKLNDVLSQSVDLFGSHFIAVKSMTEVKDKEQKLTGYRINISLQDPNSPFYLELISVKISNLNPTISYQEMLSNKTREVLLENFSCSQYKENLYFSATNILPVTK
jgi:hypothetical protein